LVEEHRVNAPNLVIIGKRGWKCQDVTNVLDNCIILKNYVFEIKNCHDLELKAYLLGTRALLFPSFIEGFGLPLIEALSLNVPVLASDIPVFHEVAGNVPEYIDPLDAIGWMNNILEYAKLESNMRNEQLTRMLEYKPPTWEDHFKIVDKILEEM
jgi:glycosyltransferase involved in cell wall biosynthesis